MQASSLKVGREPSPRLARAALWSLVLIALPALLLSQVSVQTLPGTYFRTSDSVASILCGAFFISVLIGIGARRTWPSVSLRPNWRAVATAALALALLTWAGAYLLLFNYPVTRDEHMVLFDMAVFADGRLVGPIAPEWRAFMVALVPAFLFERGDELAWVSAYGPGNAALRLMLAKVIDHALVGPLLIAVGLLALFAIARRLFPSDRGAQLVALLLYALSAQVIVNAMTVYAMTAHLALNLLWLLLFLRGGAIGHGGAMAVGFVATGLHQIIFHPLFVLPFLEHLRRSGQWRVALAYTFAYALIGLFWMSYTGFVATAAGLSPKASSAGLGFFHERILPLLVTRDPGTTLYMLYNLVRFVTWQHLALIPLLLAALPAVNRAEELARPLLLGVILTLVAMTLLLPYQGHGWGYRYLHGLIGSMALLGGYGWRHVRGDPAARPALFLATALTLLAVLPWQLAQAHRFVAPYARTDAALGNIDADMIVIDTAPIGFAVDQVRNRPDLSNRPLRFSSEHLSAKDISSLCRRGDVEFVTREWMQRFGLGIEHGRSGPGFLALRQAAQRAGCRAS